MTIYLGLQYKFECVLSHSAAKTSLDEFHDANVCLTVAVVTGSTIRMVASLARLGKDALILELLCCIWLGGKEFHELQRLLFRQIFLQRSNAGRLRQTTRTALSRESEHISLGLSILSSGAFSSACISASLSAFFGE